MSHYLFETGIIKLSERIDIVTDKNDQFRNYIDHPSKKENLRTNISWVIARLLFAIEIPNQRSIQRFNEYLELYNRKNNSTISFSELKEKNWIRIIFNSIEFPNQIQRQFRALKNDDVIQLSQTNLDHITFLYQYNEVLETETFQLSDERLLKIISQEEYQLLIDKEVVKSTDGLVEILFENNFFQYLKNEISSALWLTLSDNISDETERVLIFVRKIVQFNIHWPDRLSDFLEYKELKSLQSVAHKILLNEEDLVNNGNEFNKIWLDSPLYSHTDLNNKIPFYKIIDESSFKLLTNIHSLKNKCYWLYEEADSVRIKYGLLLNIILQTVKPSYQHKVDSDIILNLLKETNRPYLVYHTSWIIKEYYQYLIPYFIVDEETCSIPFLLLNEIKIKQNATEKKGAERSHDNKKDNELKTQIYKSLVNLFLDKISLNQTIDDESSLQFYNLYKLQSDYFYKNTSYTNQLNHLEERTRFEALLNLFSEKRFSGSFTGVIRPRVFPKLLSFLIERVIYDLGSTESTKYIGFNCSKFEQIYQILELSNVDFLDNELGTDDRNNLIIQKANLVCHWRDLYLDYFGENEIEVFSHETGKKILENAIRQSHPSGIEILNWGHFWAFLNENNLLIDTLTRMESSLSFDDTEFQYNSDLNLESKAKIILLMKSVALGIIELDRDKTQFSIAFRGIEPLINQLQSVLKSYTIKHCTTDLSRQRINVFNEINASLNNDIYFQPSINLVFIALNKVDESSLIKFHKTLLENNLDLLFLLTILNLSKSDKVIHLLTKQIENVDVDLFINNVSNVDQWKNAIIEALNSSTHFEIASPIISKIEAWISKVSIPVNNYSNFIFRTKLMLAFKRKNLVEINQIKRPERNYVSASPIDTFEEQRKYYSALHWGYNENQFEKAINIFRQLISNNSNDANSHYNVFHLSTLLNIKSGNSEELFRIKLEWNQFVDQSKEDTTNELKLIHSNVDYTSLFHYCHFRDYNNIDLIVQKLPDILKYDRQIIEPIFQSYLERELPVIASTYLRNVELYFHANGEHTPNLVIELRETINDNKLILDLKAAYNEIYCLPFKELPSVVPRSLNGKSNIQEFIFIEIIQASLILLEKINSIYEIKNENKYNDLLLATLRLRFAVWNWDISDQDRSGESNSDGNELGELDFTIKSAGNTIALIEALILNYADKAYTEEHIKKCFTYLSHSKVHYIVVYFKGKKENFESSWASYKTNVSQFAYDDDQKLTNKDFNDTSGQTNKNGVNTGITNHVNGVNMYHIYLNVSSKKILSKK